MKVVSITDFMQLFDILNPVLRSSIINDLLKEIETLSSIPVDDLGIHYQKVLYRAGKNGEPNHQKTFGIFYTPLKYVQWILNRTLKPRLEQCSDIEDISQVTLLDPA